MERIQAEGQLRVVTRYGPTTYYKGINGEAGLEYDLAKKFAETLGVELSLISSEKFSDILPKVESKTVHFAAAGLSITDERKTTVRFSPSYHKIMAQVAYKKKDKRPPKNLDKFTHEHVLHVVEGSSHISSLTTLKETYPALTWKTVPTDSLDLLQQILDEKIDYALVDSNILAHVRQVSPELKRGLSLPKKQYLAWAFPRTEQDNSLYLAAIQFINRLRRSGELEVLIELYNGYIDTGRLAYVNTSTFYRHVNKRLPKYRKYFEQVATRYNMDWRLLAAMGYQESHWDKNAVSFTGVKGIMMLTNAAAKDLGIKDRTDPFQSISGGSLHFQQLKKRIKGNVLEPDLTWLALAAYNVGLGHIMDVRKLTRKRGGNANRWVDIKKNLPLLTKPYWYRQTRHGYARGYEPIRYVQNIRRYYELLKHMDAEKIHTPEPVTNNVTPSQVPAIPKRLHPENNTPML